MTQDVRMDLDRAARCGHMEAIYAPGKRIDELLEAIRQVGDTPLLATRVSAEQAAQVSAALGDSVVFDPRSRCIHSVIPTPLVGDVAVLSAGSSDLQVAEEAALACEMHGIRVRRFYDVGVAGIHRTFNHLEAIRAAQVTIVVAGMDGALPSVVGGLVSSPVIAVPTSVGYGSAFEGLSALLAMLNSCAAGVTVVNIDNGFGAGIAATRLRGLLQPITKETTS